MPVRAERPAKVIPAFHLSVFVKPNTPLNACRSVASATLVVASALMLFSGMSRPGRLEAQEACPQGRVSRIFIDNRDIFDLQEVEEAPFQWAFKLANDLHVRTKATFLRRELLFSVNDCYEPFRVADSERILRRYPFIAQVEVYGIEQPDGTWHVIVETRDEWTTVFELAPDLRNGVQLGRAELREDNLLGRGMVIGAFYRERDAQRQQGVVFATPRLFNSRTNATLRAGNTRAGSFFEQEIFHPFVGEVGRVAWRQHFRRQTDFFSYSIGEPGGPAFLLLPFEDRRIETSFAVRFGQPGNLTTVGLGVARVDLDFSDYPSGVERVEGFAFSETEAAADDEVVALQPQTRYSAGTRLNLLLGQRNIRFTQRRGLDALRGLQDLQVGSEIALTLGRTIGGVGSDVPDDLYTRLRLYAAGAPGKFTLISNLAFEGRHLYAQANRESGWRDVLAEADLLTYWQPDAAPGHTLVGRISASGGWALDQPFQLTLGGGQALRGYQDPDFPGGRSVVFSAEDRLVLGGPFRDFFDLGTTIFADVGRMWAGDVPFGRDSGWRGTVGAGLRFGFPSGSRGVVRIDAAMPIGGGRRGSKPILLVSFGDLLGFTQGLEDFQMARSRRMTIGPDRFSPTQIQP